VGPGAGVKVLGGTAVLREPVGVVAAITPFNFPLSLNLVKLGPVAAVIAFDTDDEAVQIANNSRYGLSGAIYRRDVGAAYEMARRLRTGQVRINGGGTAPDLDAPMAGWKASGMGAEYALPGLLEFTQLKSVGFRAG
jgi:aldehyde dehydrogenase (NAD+)